MKVVICDGKNLAYRCFVGGDFTTKSGEHVEVPYLFIKILSKIVREIQSVDRVIVCWDGGLDPFRLQFYPKYKQRDGLSPDLAELGNQVSNQYAKLKTILEPMGVFALQYYGVEADDLIAYLTKLSQIDDYIIVSADKDYRQLVNEKISVFDGRDRWNTKEHFEALNKGLTPNGFLHAHAILGDGSDNIDGIEGIGWGTITDLAGLLNELKSPNDLIPALKKSYPKPSKRIQSIIDNESIYLRNLALIDLRRPRIAPEVMQDIDLRLNNPPQFNHAQVFDFLKKHEMTSLMTKFQYWFAVFMGLK